MAITILEGDCRNVLLGIEARSAQCCVTSPPYFGLRNYGVAGQIGAEETPDEYVASLIAAFRVVRHVLRSDGTLWLNLGDSYHNLRTHMNGGTVTNTVHRGGARDGTEGFARSNRNKRLPGLKDKDLIGIPWRVALAMQADGWWLRSAIVWHKPNPMPEKKSLDRPLSAYEMLFLFTQDDSYFYNRDIPQANVWTIATASYAGHLATFPPELAERCIRAGSKEGDTILDPFAGAFTAPLVADRLRRHAVGIELNPSYCDIARRRIEADAGMFAEVN